MRIGLLRQLANRLAQGGDRFRELVELAVDASQGSPAIAVFRAQLESGVELASGLGVASNLHVEHAQYVRRLGRGGVEFLGNLKLRNRALGVVLHLQGEAQVVVKLGRIR